MKLQKTLKKKKILIIGGTGFIGSHLVKKCSNFGANVTSVSLSLPKKNKRIKKVNYHKIDLTNFLSVRKKLDTSFDYIINLGGYINYSNSKKDYRKIMNEHFFSIKNIIRILPKKNLKKFVQIGSSSEYGQGKAPQSENTKLSPQSSYSLAKVKTAKYLKRMYKTQKYPYTIARLFLVYGPGQKKNRFIPEIIKKCLKNKKFPTTSGEQIRDFCYIDDVISGILLLMVSKKTVGKIYNVATGIPIKIKTIIILIKKIVAKGKPEFNKRELQKGENEILYANINKIKNKLNWKPKVKLLTGLKKTIIFFKKNNAK